MGHEYTPGLTGWRRDTLRTWVIQLAMSRRKQYCVSLKLKAVEKAEKKSKEAAAREFSVAWILREFESTVH